MNAEPELEATLTGGNHPMVKVDGEVIEIGQSIRNYLLVEVGERSAVFLKDGREIHIEMQETEESTGT